MLFYKTLTTITCDKTKYYLDGAMNRANGKEYFYMITTDNGINDTLAIEIIKTGEKKFHNVNSLIPSKVVTKATDFIKSYNL